MTVQRTDGWDREVTLVSQIAAAASLLSFLYYFRHGDLLLYGDAVAHINIARRVIDSRTPGLFELGTVWLPLPHLLMIPFLFADAAWQTGLAGSIPSMGAYVFAATGMFRLVRGWLRAQKPPSVPARIAAWLAAAIYAANPNLLYLQSTAMTEVLYSALFIWALVYGSEFCRAAEELGRSQADSSLRKCGWCLAGACLTRYDGWFLAGVIGVVVAWVIVRSRENRTALGRSLAGFLLLAACAPLLWLGYNALVYRDPLEFARGPYSARAIEQKAKALRSSSYPGWHDPKVSFSYFLKAAEANMAEKGWEQKVWLGLFVVGIGIVVLIRRRLWPLVLVAIPLPFYTLSVAYGSVPIYLPHWWPSSYYNVRFGAELIPAFAVFAAVTIDGGLHRARPTWIKAAIVGALVALIATSYAGVWKAQPICYREAWANSLPRIAFEKELAATLLKLPPDSDLLMYLGDHVGALEDAGIPLRRVINEGNHRPWKRPSDPDGLWEKALADPLRYVDYVIAIDDDPVAEKVEHRDLVSVVVVHTLGQAPATLYWTHRQKH
jgi:Ca2+/Na+ antiporter